MYRRISTWVVAAGIVACVAAYVWPSRDAPVPAPVPVQTVVAAEKRPSWFAIAPPMPGTASASAQEPERPLVGRNGRIVDLGGLDVAQYIAQREGAARLGNMKAVYEVYQAEALCANVDEPLPDTQDATDREQLERTRARQRTQCANISPIQVQERMRYLKLAADAGNADAQVDYFMEGPAGRPIDVAASADDPVLKQWKQDAMGYLKAAGAHCNPDALSLLSNAYDAGSIVERDPGLVAAYGVAAARARGIDKTPAQWKLQFGEDLSDADFDAALKRDLQPADGACRR